ncbi:MULTISPECIES: hypothetical protein [Providencia]|uniref:hypothetical protein n=1 Tax=Providencia TaxID=586 RepID=UPI0023627FD6|nr:hypothetical protein [Providencia rettgeri]
MSDKKEIATLSIKISVDSTDLDKLEAQLKRIEGLMVSTGLKQATSVGFSADMFFVTNGQVLINEEHTEKALTSPATILRTNEAIPTEQSEFEKFKQQVESEFSQLHSSITAIQHTQANSEIASANAIEQFRADIQRKASLNL